MSKRRRGEIERALAKRLKKEGGRIKEKYEDELPKSRGYRLYIRQNEESEPIAIGDVDVWLKSTKNEELVLIELECGGHPAHNTAKILHYIKKGIDYKDKEIKRNIKVIQLFDKSKRSELKKVCDFIGKNYINGYHEDSEIDAYYFSDEVEIPFSNVDKASDEMYQKVTELLL
ncbi:MAG: hypothetical protein PHD13_05970 [Methanocellales archaeon]|nr:hypothetical protein [Methanocellales archaeon]MDD3292014.1 hypothetical protein [Methanocellales archaeon]MDD5235703.1 hypothetical protein [Methanocellales archaeon]MDD5485629.1 hypothetical protein [Methanocellales archaeon]